jgi:VWFA-related protein
LAGLLIALSLMRLPPRTQTRLSTRVDALRLDVYADVQGTRERLTAEDFQVLDNGRPRAKSLIDVSSMPINVVLVLDTSRSTAGPRLSDLISAVDAVLARLRPADRAGLLTFSDVVTPRVPPTFDFEAIHDALKVTHPIGRTSLLDSLLAGFVAASQVRGRTMLILCLDGIENTSFLSRVSVANALRGSEVVLYTVTTRRSESLDGLADLSGGESLVASGKNSLVRAFAGIIDQFRRRYLLNVPLDSDASPGWHRLSVRLTRRHGKVHHRSGYWLPARGGA